MKQIAKKKTRHVVVLILLLALSITTVAGLYVAKILHEPLVNKSNSTIELYVTQKLSQAELIQLLIDKNIIDSPLKFKLISTLKQFKHSPKQGRYEIPSNWSLNQLVNTLRIGNRAPIEITFNNIRTPQQLAGRLSAQMAFDSTSFINLLLNKPLLKQHGFKPENIVCCFIPNTYQVYWNTSPEKLLQRMIKEYNSFWTKERKQKAQEAGLSITDVYTIASIVEEETIKKNERPKVAGLYINRVKRGMLLQADPTLKFAWNNFELKRVLNKHKQIDSPYNTYKYAGLPPGPIRIPDPTSIDAVLNYTKHKYLYMVAKADFSGYHHFSKTLREHNRYAKIYQNELNRRRIYK